MNRPYVVCHMLTSLDGKIDGAYMSAPECVPALAAYGDLRGIFRCQATLYGTTAMAGSYSDGYIGQIEAGTSDYPKEDYVAVSDAESYVISVDPNGTLAFPCNTIEKKGRMKAHIVEVLTEAVQADYLAYLREKEISYIFAGKNTLDCKLLLEKLYRLFSIKRLMIAGGGLMNWSFVQDDLVDELSIVMAPVADGSTRAVSIFEKADYLPTRSPAAFKLKEIKTLDGDTLWLRYTIRYRKAAQC